METGNAKIAIRWRGVYPFPLQDVSLKMQPDNDKKLIKGKQCAL